MKNKFTRTVLILFLSFSVFNLEGQVVDQVTAETIALNFYTSQSVFYGHEKSKLQIAETEVIYTNDLPVIYTVKIREGGFVILAAEERAWPILGFGVKKPGIGEKPAALKAWEQNWVQQITEIREANTPVSAEIQNEWYKLQANNLKFNKSITSYLEPLLFSEWGQQVFYNALCPDDPDGPGGHAQAGCVAIAISQVIYYFRYPQSGSGSHGYNSDYGYEFADYENTTYHWDHMVNAIYGLSNPDIAELIYHVGVAVEMDYGASGSGALTQDGVNALTQYFNYAPDANFINRFDIPDSFKDSLIVNLSQNRPCIVRGGELSGSHSFVCDGYHDSLYFHFNWGWNGNYDGYFFIDNLNPWVYDFTFNQGAIINILPGDSYPDYCQGADTLTKSRGTFTDGSGNKNYNDNSQCSWLIGSDDKADEQVMLWFPYFDLEPDKDFVYIYDGTSIEAPLLGMLTGEETAQEFISANEHLFVVFESDGDGQAGGFLAEYVTIDGPWCDDAITLHDINRPWFSDASGPYPYASNSDCNWIIQPEGEEHDSIDGVFLFFHEFDLAAGDTLFVADGNNPELNPIVSLTSASSPDTIFTNTNNLHVRFKTDPAFVADGWGAGYGSLFPVYCSDTVFYHEKIGSISDGSGDKNYINNSNCFYDIYYPEGHAISVEFTEFELEWGYDRLQIYDVSNQNPVLLKTLWGDIIPEPVTFETNHLLINFVTDFSNVFKGWHLEYNALAPGIKNDHDAHNLQIYPNPFEENLRASFHTLPSKEVHIDLYDLFGTPVYQSQFYSMSDQVSKEINLATLANGIYILKIQTGDAVMNCKVLKQ